MHPRSTVQNQDYPGGWALSLSQVTLESLAAVSLAQTGFQNQTKRVAGEGAGGGGEGVGAGAIQPGPKQRLHQHVFLSSFIYEYRCSPKRFSKEKSRPLCAESVAIPAMPHWETLKILGGDPTKVSQAAPLRECLQEEEGGAQGP